jgi:hypothetical protein
VYTRIQMISPRSQGTYTTYTSIPGVYIYTGCMLCVRARASTLCVCANTVCAHAYMHTHSVYAQTQELFAEHDAAVVAVAVTRDSRTVASGQVSRALPVAAV